MIVILSAQVLNHSSLEDNGHGLACKLRGFASGGNGHGPVEQTEEVNIPNLYSTFTSYYKRPRACDSHASLYEESECNFVGKRLSYYKTATGL